MGSRFRLSLLMLGFLQIGTSAFVGTPVLAAPAQNCPSALIHVLRERPLTASSFERVLNDRGLPDWKAAEGSRQPAGVLASRWKHKALENGKIGGFKIERRLAQGMQNEGLYFFRHSDGSQRVIKVLPLSATDAERDIQRLAQADPKRPVEAEPVTRALEYAFGEIHGAYLAQEIGGAKVFSFGTLALPDDRGNSIRRIYIEMENMLAGEKAYPLKTLRDFPLTRVSQQSGSKALREMAANLVRAAEKHIVPRDPDFLIGENGAVRWLDSGDWYKEPGRERFLDGQYGSVADSFLDEFRAARISPAAQQAGRIFLDEFLVQLGRSREFTEAQKERLITSVYSRFSYAPNLAEMARQRNVLLLRNLGYVGASDTSFVDPAQVVLARYRQLREKPPR